MKNFKTKMIALLVTAAMLPVSTAFADHVDISAVSGFKQDFETLTLTANNMKTEADPDYGQVMSATGGYYQFPITQDTTSGTHILSFDMKTSATTQDQTFLDVFFWGDAVNVPADGDTGIKQVHAMTLRGDGAVINISPLYSGLNTNPYLIFNRDNREFYQPDTWTRIDLVFNMDGDTKTMYGYSTAGGEGSMVIYNNMEATDESDAYEKGIKSLTRVILGGRQAGVKMDNISFVTLNDNVAKGDLTRLAGGKLELDFRLGLKADFATSNAITLSRTPIGGGASETLNATVEKVVGSKVVIVPDAEMFVPGYDYTVTAQYVSGGVLGNATVSGKEVVFPVCRYPATGTVAPAWFDTMENYQVGNTTGGIGDEGTVTANGINGNYVKLDQSSQAQYYRIGNDVGVDSGDYILSFDWNPWMGTGGDQRLELFVQTNSPNDSESWTQYPLFVTCSTGIIAEIPTTTTDGTNEEGPWMVNPIHGFWLNNNLWQHIDFIFHLNPDENGDKWMEIFSSTGQSRKIKIFNSDDTTGAYVYGIKNFVLGTGSGGTAIGLDNVYFGPYTDVNTITGNASVKDGNFVVNYYANLRTASTGENVFHITNQAGEEIDYSSISVKGSEITIVPRSPLASGTYTIVPKVKLNGTEYDAVTQCGARVVFPSVTHTEAVNLKIIDADGNVAVANSEGAYPSSTAGFDIVLQDGLFNNAVDESTITITDEDEGTAIGYTAVYEDGIIKIRFNKLLGQEAYISLSVTGLKDASGVAYEKEINQEVATDSTVIQTIEKPTLNVTSGAAVATVPCINTGAEAMNGIVIIAGYVGTELVSVSAQPLSVVSMDKDAVKIFTMSGDTTAFTKIAVYVWDSLTGMNPLTAPTVE